MTGEAAFKSSSPEDDPLLGFESLVPVHANRVPTNRAVSFDNLLEPPLLLHEDIKEGCGGQLWPAGIVLAKYLLRHHSFDLAEKTILELGAGGGLVGLGVARGCRTTKSIRITDQLPMLSLMQRNIALNSLEDKVTAEVLDWGTPIPPPSDKESSSLISMVEERYPDIILAADCVYFEPAFPLLLRTMQQLLGPKTVCYFCFKKRRKADWRFIRDMKKRFEVVDTKYDDQDQDRRDGIHLYEVKRKQ